MTIRWSRPRAVAAPGPARGSVLVACVISSAALSAAGCLPRTSLGEDDRSDTGTRPESGPVADVGAAADVAVPRSDAGATVDTSVIDMAVADTAAMDTAAMDTAAMDTAVMDTAVMDTAAMDTAAMDVVRPTETGADSGTVAEHRLALGQFHSCAVRADGRVRCWGGNGVGAVGTGAASASVRTPVDVVGLPLGSRVFAGGRASYARRPDGTVMVWGWNRADDMGGPPIASTFTPVAAPAELTGALFVGIGATNRCALLPAGVVRCWRSRLDSVLGYVDNPPMVISGLGVVTQLAAGSGGSVCGVLADATVSCFTGYGGFSPPVAVAGLRDVVQVATNGLAGMDSFCAVLRDGTVRCWGGNAAGQLGDGTTTSRPTPVAVVGLSNAVEVAAGNGFACARLRDGTARCWGANSAGQLGDGTTTSRLAPTVVSGLADVVEIATSSGFGAAHACARLGDGSVRCWGENGDGQLGDGTTTNRLVPTPVGL